MTTHNTGYLPNIDDVQEFVGQLIDVFEDYLDRYGASGDPPAFSEFVDGFPHNYHVFISGEKYDELQDAIESVLERWNLISRKNDVDAC